MFYGKHTSHALWASEIMPFCSHRDALSKSVDQCLQDLYHNHKIDWTDLDIDLISLDNDLLALERLQFMHCPLDTGTIAVTKYNENGTYDFDAICVQLRTTTQYRVTI